MHPDTVSRLVLDAYHKLPKKGKPVVRSNGDHEWTVLAGLVVELGDNDDDVDDNVECVCVATGLKATPNDQVSKAKGLVLHDTHAEVLAMRGFNRWLAERLGDCKWFFDGGQRFKGSVHMYVSEAPCGDASLGHFDGTAWEDDAVTTLNEQEHGPVVGRDHFCHTGVVRTKPGRRDALRTYSKSCSDKLTVRQATSLVLGCMARYVDPVYLDTLVVPLSRHLERDFARAFGRAHGDTVRRFKVETTVNEFQQQRERGRVPCPQSLIWVSGHAKAEAVVKGIKAGAKPTRHGASMVSRYQFMKYLDPQYNGSYLEWKSSQSRQDLKRQVYVQLGGQWVPTAKDDFFL